MAGNLTDLFSDEETCNWFKSSIALIVTKQGLDNFVDSEIQKMHSTIGMSCGNCCTENIVKCPTPGICRVIRCSYHKTPILQFRNCPSSVCNTVQTNIASHHRYHTPSWKNTKAELWTRDPWEVAKCFLPPDGYIDVSSVRETDFNGLISVMMNCTHFDKCVSFTIAPRSPSPACILTQALHIGRQIRHTTNCKVTNADFTNFLQILTTLLSDPVCIANDPDATTARSKFAALQNNQPFISPENLVELLKDAQLTLVNLTRSGERLTKEGEGTLEEIESLMNNFQANLYTKTQEARAHVSEEESNAREKKETHKLASMDVLEKKSLEMDQRLIEERDTALKVISSHTKTCLESIDSTAQKASEHVSKEERNAREEIETHKLASLNCLEKKSLEIEKRLFEETDSALKVFSSHAKTCFKNIDSTADHISKKEIEFENTTEKLDEMIKEVNKNVQKTENTAKTVRYYARQIEQHAIKTDKKLQEIEIATCDPITSIDHLWMDKDKTKYERDIEDLRRRLIRHYNGTLNHVALSPLNPSNDNATSLYKVYAAPKLYRLDRKYTLTGAPTTNFEQGEKKS